MLGVDTDKLYPSAKTLVEERVASRLHAKDATLYSFSEEAQEYSSNFMGWVDLASNPPYPPEKIQKFAYEVHDMGIDTVVLIGQGGSSQAPMTVTKYNKVDSQKVKFRILDSDCPVRIRELMAAQSLSARGQIGALPGYLGVPDWRVRNHVTWARAFEPASLRRALLLARDAEKAMKSGADPEQAFQDWYLAVISPSRNR